MASNDDEVMIVEDERESRTYLVKLLELEGFKVVAFSNGCEALEYLAHSAPPCVVIFDIRMPVMDGPQFRAAMLQFRWSWLLLSNHPQQRILAP